MLLAAAVQGARRLRPWPARPAPPAPPVTLRLARTPTEVPDTSAKPPKIDPPEVPGTSGTPPKIDPPEVPSEVPGASGKPPKIDQIAPAEGVIEAPPVSKREVLRGLEGVPDTSARVPDTSGKIALGSSGLDDLAPVVPPPPPWNAHAYGNRVRQRIEAHQRYPARARRQSQEGEPLIAVTVRADGHLAAPPRLVRSSGVAALDREALRMARAAAPFPPPAASAPVVIQVPVRFSLAEP